jgi:hypothetical protein
MKRSFKNIVFEIEKEIPDKILNKAVVIHTICCITGHLKWANEIAKKYFS